jgi:hypothetical protein
MGVASWQQHRESLVEAALRVALPAVLLACAAGCAPASPPPPPKPEPMVRASEPAPARLGTIVAIRRIGAARAAEFVVREDTGATIVVVQPDSDGLAVGERVALMAESRTRIARTR